MIVSNDRSYTISYIAGNPEFPLLMTLDVPEGAKHGYNYDDPKYPGQFRIWVNDRTIFIPLDRLVSLELNF